MTIALSRNPWPALCTTARLGVDSPPMNSETPTMPSLPTTAISAEAPFSITYKRETIAVVGKYTWLKVPPDSYSTDPKGISTDSRRGIQRCASVGGKAPSRWFWLGWVDTPIWVLVLSDSKTSIKSRPRAGFQVIALAAYYFGS